MVQQMLRLVDSTTRRTVYVDACKDDTEQPTLSEVVQYADPDPYGYHGLTAEHRLEAIQQELERFDEVGTGRI